MKLLALSQASEILDRKYAPNSRQGSENWPESLVQTLPVREARNAHAENAGRK